MKRPHRIAVRLSDDELARPESATRVASFTSVSGPSADHLNRFAVTSLKRPYRLKAFARAVDGLARLAYMGAFSIPVLAPAAIRFAFARGAMRRQLLRDPAPPDVATREEALALLTALARDQSVTAAVGLERALREHDETDPWTSLGVERGPQ